MYYVAFQHKSRSVSRHVATEMIRDDRPYSLVLGMMSSLTRSVGMMPKLTYNRFPPKSWSQNNNNNIFLMRWFILWWVGVEAEWRPASILQYITSWYILLITNCWGKAFPFLAHKLSNNMYIVQKVVYIGMLPNIDMPTNIGPCSDENLYVRSPYRWCVQKS